METIKNKSELLKEMQLIADDVNQKKSEVESLLRVIENLEKQYYEIAEQIQKN